MVAVVAVEALAGRRLIVEIVGGGRDGEIVVLTPDRPGSRCAPLERLLGRFELDPVTAEAIEALNATRPAPRRALVPGRTLASRRAPGEASAYERSFLAASASSQRVANALLESLLEAEQLEQWRTLGRFRVTVPQGVVELGTLYDLRFEPRHGPVLSLCAVPEEHATLPVADIWTTLLLTLRVTPDAFFAVANHRPFGSRRPHRPGPVPLLVAS